MQIFLKHNSTSCPLTLSDVCEHMCSEKVKLCLATAASALLFPLLVWGGYTLLPFDAPLLDTAPLRLVYSLRCSFFAIIPIVLGKTLITLIYRTENFVHICVFNIILVLIKSFPLKYKYRYSRVKVQSLKYMYLQIVLLSLYQLRLWCLIFFLLMHSTN